MKSNKPQLLILTTHPIQYQVPLFRALADEPEIDTTVIFASLNGAVEGYDREFGFEYKWDVPLLDGYSWELLENRARKPAVGPFFGTNLPGLSDRIRELAPDVLLIPGWGKRCYVQAMRTAFRLQIPVLVRGEARIFKNQLWTKKMIKKMVVAPAMRRVSGVLPIGKCNREFYEWCGVNESRFFDSFYFVNNSFFSEAGREKRTATPAQRKTWGLPEDAVVFIFVGKFLPKKRPMDILRAFRQVVEAHPKPGKADNIPQKTEPESASQDVRSANRKQNVHLLMVGDGKLRSECEKYVKDHALPVTFAGFLNQTDLTDAYAVSDCLVLPSDARETWGLVVNEAMASGLTAIVSDQVGCAPDLIDEAETGFTFPLADIDALADRIGEVVQRPAMLQNLKNNAATKIEQYDLEQAVRGVVTAVQDVKQRETQKPKVKDYSW